LAYAAAQAERNNSPNWPLELTPELVKEADQLSKKAQKGELALFVGAGVSMAAGLPGWGELLQRLAKKAEMTPDERQTLGKLTNVLDQATIIERRFGAETSLGAAVKEVFSDYHHYALSHALLASLPVREVITTNYDELFEAAWALSDPDGLSILPVKTQKNTRRWLFKMHGCVTKPDQVVLTRSDYTQYDMRLPALAGVLQALLITRHMLFVGFSLNDDNFHRIVDSVRRIRTSNTSEGCFGTTLALGHGGLIETLWEKDLYRVRMAENKDGEVDSDRKAARTLEIFLDYLLASTRDTRHLLVGKRFDKVLSEEEKRVRDALDRFISDLRPDAKAIKETIAWRHIEQMLLALGYDPKL
jgi:hypothetical protein